MKRAIGICHIIMQLAAFLFVFILQACATTPIWEKGKPKHHTTEGFRNFPIVEDSSTLGFSFYMNRFISSFSLPVVPESHLLSEENSIALYQKLEGKNTITWIGQSTLLIRIEGKTILTDPFLSKYASPFPVGPRRYVNPGISPENILIMKIGETRRLPGG